MKATRSFQGCQTRCCTPVGRVLGPHTLRWRGPEWGPTGEPAPGASGPAELQGGRPTAAMRPGLRARMTGQERARPSTRAPADFPSLQCGQEGQQLHLRPCDLHAVSRRFEEGHYKSVVSEYTEGAAAPRLGRGLGWGLGSDKPPYSTASWRTW